MIDHDRLVRLIYESVTAPERWPDVGRLLAEITASRGATMFAVDKQSGAVDVFFDQEANEGWDEYVDHYLSIDPRIARASEVMEIQTEYDFITETEMDRHEYYDWLKNYDYRYHAGVKLLETASLASILTIQRAPIEGNPGPETLRLFENLTQHLHTALKLSVQLEATRLQRDLMNAGLETMTTAALVVDRGNTIVFANRAARTVLSEADGISDRGGMLTLAQTSSNQRLQRSIGKALQDRIVTNASDSLVVSPRPSGKRPYSIVVGPLRPTAESSLGHKNYVLVYITDPEAQPRGIADVMSLAYDLTPAEGALVAALVDGKSVLDYAETEGVSKNTVRWHLKQVFAKTETRSQSELVRLVFRSTPPIQKG